MCLGQCPFPALLSPHPCIFLVLVCLVWRVTLESVCLPPGQTCLAFFIRRAVDFWANMVGIIFMILSSQGPSMPSSALFLNFLKFCTFLKFIHRHFIFLLHSCFFILDYFIFDTYNFDIYKWALIHYPLFIYWEKQGLIYLWLVHLRLTLSFWFFGLHFWNYR